MIVVIDTFACNISSRLIGLVQRAHDKPRHEVTQVGAKVQSATA